MDNSPQFYSVRLKYSVWPEIYGDERPILFPTLEAALRFAECNLSALIPQARIYSPDRQLLCHLPIRGNNTPYNETPTER
jgi:hypothetical protein